MMNDVISRQTVLDIVDDLRDRMTVVGYWSVVERVKALPSAQPTLSEAYSKAVFTWLMDYQIRVAELKGRYTPYEVLSWVINDWGKEHE